MKRLADIVLPLAVAALLLGVWEWAAAHWQVPVYVLPAPSAIARAFAGNFGSLMEALADEPEPEAARLGQIGCFVVAPARRHAGVAGALLRAACEGFRAQGLDWAEASPAPDAAGDAQNHFGPLAMFLAAGFTPHRSDDAGRLRVRLDLHRGAG